MQGICKKNGVLKNGFLKNDILKNDILKNDILKNGFLKNDILKNGIYKNRCLQYSVYNSFIQCINLYVSLDQYFLCGFSVLMLKYFSYLFQYYFKKAV